MTSWPWIVFAASISVKAAIVLLSNDYRRGLMLLGPTVFVELFPVLVSNRTTKWSATVQTLEDFGRRGNSLVPLGALLMLAALSLGVVVTVAVTSLLRSGVSQMPAHVSEQWSDQLTEELLSFHVPSLPALGIGDLLLLVIIAPMAFLIGRWMGRDLSPSVPSAQGAGNVVAAYLCGMVMPMFLVLAVASTEKSDIRWLAVSRFDPDSRPVAVCVARRLPERPRTSTGCVHGVPVEPGVLRGPTGHSEAGT